MATLGQDLSGREVVVDDVCAIDQVDWAVTDTGEYRYEFAMPDGSVAVILAGQLGPAGREIVALFASDYE